MEHHSELLDLVQLYSNSEPAPARPSKKRPFAMISNSYPAPSDDHADTPPPGSSTNCPLPNGSCRMMGIKRRKLNDYDCDSDVVEIPHSEDLGQYIIRNRQASKDKQQVPFKSLVKKEASKNRQPLQEGTGSKSKYTLINPAAHKITVEPIVIMQTEEEYRACQ